MSEPEHNLGDVWGRLNQQSDQIASIAKGQAGTDARLQSLESKFDDGFMRLNRTLETLSDRVNRPPPATNWIGFGSMSAAIVTLMAGFVILVTSPMSETQRNLASTVVRLNDDMDQKLTTMNSELTRRAFTIGADSKSIEWHAHQLSVFENQMDIERSRNADIEERVSRMEGRQEMLVDRVKDIDDKGSRKWNDADRQN